MCVYCISSYKHCVCFFFCTNEFCVSSAWSHALPATAWETRVPSLRAPCPSTSILIMMFFTMTISALIKTQESERETGREKLGQCVLCVVVVFFSYKRNYKLILLTSQNEDKRFRVAQQNAWNCTLENCLFICRTRFSEHCEYFEPLISYRQRLINCENFARNAIQCLRAHKNLHKLK